jgi:hypothetical protein
MRPIRIPLNYRLTNEPFDTRVGAVIGYLAAIAIVPVAVVALVRHPGSRADFLLGLGLAVLMALLFVMLGILSRHVGGIRDKVTMRSRWLEVTSYVVCMVVTIVGVESLAGLGLTPVQVTLGLLLLCSLSLAVLVLGMMTTVVRSLNR